MFTHNCVATKALESHNGLLFNTKEAKQNIETVLWILIMVVLLLWRSSKIVYLRKFKEVEQSIPSTFITNNHEGAGIE